MIRSRISWDSGQWTTVPISVTETKEGQYLKVESREGSDYWEKTLYGFQRDSGHSLLTRWEKDTAMEVTFQLQSFTELYDQAGIMLMNAPGQWIKAGIEINDGIPQLAVVVTQGYSDWSLAPVPEWIGENVTIRASRMNDAVIIRARTETHPWRTLRVAPFPINTASQAGPFICSPTRSGLHVTFTRWVMTDPDSDIHVDPSTED
ncbi:regulation of enolase protein 1 (concanavalin A-like superfamily) [Paenibacillus sp. LBL]|uniref:DUF1349 domain-containing protein n=1 Tax=Paenibacillus TaxID=44249 RepID=UPI002473D6DD|nr:DUF1349 domain-containing protein [Paenibacillus sp. LBL]MDH6671655.1 regulation of enolase protein 1 (concanavalin A-like superfamily) [Paenibacillus sp. LBL]